MTGRKETPPDTQLLMEKYGYITCCIPRCGQDVRITILGHQEGPDRKDPDDTYPLCSRHHREFMENASRNGLDRGHRAETQYRRNPVGLPNRLWLLELGVNLYPVGRGRDLQFREEQIGAMAAEMAGAPARTTDRKKTERGRGWKERN